MIVVVTRGSSSFIFVACGMACGMELDRGEAATPVHA